jgi:hypothetical protein
MIRIEAPPEEIHDIELEQGLFEANAKGAGENRERPVRFNKIELAERMGVGVEDLAKDVHKLKPDPRVIPTRCKTGAELDDVATAILAV